jgi:predicted DNA-binding transcriptional regulator AlpA
MSSQNELYSIPGFVETHGISRTQIYREMASGRLLASKVGKRTMITAENAAAWRAALPAFAPTR